MTKKHFIALADEMRDVIYEPEFADYPDDQKPLLCHKDLVVEALCHFMRSQNPAFNEQHWRDYLAGKCGPNGGKR